MIAIEIPEEVYTMKAKRSIIKCNAEAYRKASKAKKKEILDDLEKALHMHRKYIITLLNRTGKVYYYTPQGVKLIGDPTITYLHLKHRYQPHPRASVLKKQIPVEPHFYKVFGRIGYTETDTVHFSGGNPGGDYCLALGDVEINMSWCEYRALRNRAHIWVEQALNNIDNTVPYQVHTRHPDGGSEFINKAADFS